MQQCEQRRPFASQDRKDAGVGKTVDWSAITPFVAARLWAGAWQLAYGLAPTCVLRLAPERIHEDTNGTACRANVLDLTHAFMIEMVFLSTIIASLVILPM